MHMRTEPMALIDLPKTTSASLLAEPAAPRDLVSISHGNAWSIYFRDPEGSRIEVFADTPWHVPQPVREPIDLDRPEADILRETEDFCRNRPGFRPMAEWRQEVAARIAAHQPS